MRQRAPPFSTSWEQGKTLAEWVAKLLPNRSTVTDLMKSRPADQRQARERTKKKRRERERERERVSFNITIYADLASNYIMFKFPAGEDWRVRNQDQKPQIKLDLHLPQEASPTTNGPCCWPWGAFLLPCRASSLDLEEKHEKSYWLTAAFSRHKNTRLPFQERLLRLL